MRIRVFPRRAITLEQQLASSLKELDKMLAGAGADRRSEGSAGGPLQSPHQRRRSAAGPHITEYAGVNERLEMLRQQHQDLEDEYNNWSSSSWENSIDTGR